MNKKPFFTIITPNYNSGELLLRGHKSLLNNKISFEHIIIDDCSSDNSLEYLDNFSKNIKIIKNDTNLGAGPSRNKGLNLANGEYILFLDADDYFVKGSLDKLKSFVDLNKNVDVILFGVKMITNINHNVPDEINESFDFRIMHNKTLLEEYLLDNILSSPWAKCIKSTLAKTHLFPDIKVSEDAIYNLNIFINTNIAISINDILYIFDKTNENSLTRKTFTKSEFLKFHKGWVFFEKKAKRDVNIFKKNDLLSVRKIYFCVFYYINRLVITSPDKLDNFVLGSIKKIFLQNYFNIFYKLSLKHNIIGWLFVLSPKITFYLIKKFLR